MATVTGVGALETGQVRARSRRLATNPFNWTVALMSAGVVGGLYLDGWAHENGRVDQSFFTPWHAVLYSGVFAIFIFLFFNQARYMAAGHSWRRALPAGYLLSLAGAIMFLFGGALDLVWHELFGIEVSLEALLSPSHLFLAASGFLMVSGPVRAVWPRLFSREPRRWTAFGPMAISLGLLLGIFGFLTEFAHPFHQPFAVRMSNQSLAMAGVLLQTALFMGIVLFPLRHGPLPFGSVALILGIGVGLQTVFHAQYQLLPAVILSGLFADLLAIWLRPSAARHREFFIFAFVVPVVFYSLYYLTLALTQGIAWTIHLWLGSIVLAGIVGLFISFLIVAPMPEVVEEQVGPR